MNVDAYLERMDYQGSRSPTLDTLRALHFQHMLHIPFENLSIGWKEPIVLDRQLIYEKIVERRRGGFCYELNGMFSWLLTELGYQVSKLSARVARGSGRYGPDYAHLTLEVDLGHEGFWLADVGFGSSFVDPLRLVPDETQIDRLGRTFRLAVHGEYWTMQHRNRQGEWHDQYRFTRQPHAFREFEKMCHYQQTSPESRFTREVFCTRATLTGRISMNDGHLTVSEGNTQTVTELLDENAFEVALDTYFGIVRVRI